MRIVNTLRSPSHTSRSSAPHAWWRTWGDDVPDGKVTDFKGAVKAKPDEEVIFSWIEYPDRATRDKANEQIMSDPAMRDMEMPFDGKRMIFAGFEPILDEGKRGSSRLCRRLSHSGPRR